MRYDLWGRGSPPGSGLQPSALQLSEDGIPPPPPPRQEAAPSPYTRRNRSSARRGTREGLLSARIDTLLAVVRHEASDFLWQDAMQRQYFPATIGKRLPKGFQIACQREFLRRSLLDFLGADVDSKRDAAISRRELCTLLLYLL